MDLPGLIKAILDRAFYSAFLVLAFSIAALVAMRFGMELPPDVVLWVNFAMLAAISLIVVEGGRRAVLGVAGGVSRARANAKDQENAIRNISALFLDEAQMLAALLQDDAPPRFEVTAGSNLAKLMNKGVLQVVGSAGYMSFLCEVHPAILERKAEIIPQLPKPEQPKPRPPAPFGGF